MELGTYKECLQSYFRHHLVKEKTLVYILINWAFFEPKLKLHLYLVADYSFAEVFKAFLEETATLKSIGPARKGDSEQ